MAVISKAVRLVGNPHRRVKTRKRVRNSRRRKLTKKQLKYFGTKAQRSRLRNSHRRANPKRKRKMQHNPALLVTLGAVNPQRRRSVAKRRRSRTRVARRRTANPHRRRRVRRNPTRVVVVAPRHRRRRRVSARRRVMNPYRRRRVVRHRGRRRNPAVFGLTGANAVKAVAGGLVGVAIAKLLPGMAPASLQGGKFMNIVLTGASAVIAGMLAKKFVDQNFGDAVLFGGLMQTGSVALNAFVPGIGGRFGLGELMSGSFPIPQNPIRAGIAPPAQARVNMSGLSRVYGTAF